MIELDASQLAAVDLVCSAQCAVVTGGPGTGKTTCLRTALDRLDAQGVRYQLAAPTGKAARRMREATGRHAQTVHRLLAFGPDPISGVLCFNRNESSPIDSDLVVIDEASMLDIELADDLARAIGSSTRLVFVGDADQLPSVGPGNVLRDIIAAGTVPVARLTTLHRAAQESWVCTQSRVVLEGALPDLNDRHDFRWLGRANRDDAIEALISAVFRELPSLDVVAGDIQVLIPQRKGPAGCELVNPRLQALLNPERDSDPQGWPLGKDVDAAILRLRDRVIQTRNDYDLGVMNGEVGNIAGIVSEPSVCKSCGGSGSVGGSFVDGNTIQDAGRPCVPCGGTGKRAPYLTVRYPADDGGVRLVEYGKGQVFALDLAYALTIHKSQGSQWPWVVVFAHSTHTRMLTRQLLYTAITRASKGVVLVGDEVGLGRAVKETRESRRNTWLSARLREVPLAPGALPSPVDVELQHDEPPSDPHRNEEAPDHTDEEFASL